MAAAIFCHQLPRDHFRTHYSNLAKNWQTMSYSLVRIQISNEKWWAIKIRKKKSSVCHGHIQVELHRRGHLLWKYFGIPHTALIGATLDFDYSIITLAKMIILYMYIGALALNVVWIKLKE